MDTLMAFAALGLAAFAAVTTLVSRKYLPTYFAKKAENLATKEDVAAITEAVEKVKAAHVSEIEKLKHQLELTTVKLKAEIDRAALEHQIRFSWYHQRKAELIATLYALLNDVVEYSKAMISPIQTVDESQRKTHATSTVELYNKLAQEYWGKKIFLEREVCDHIERVIRIIRDALSDFEISQDPDISDRHLWGKAYKSMADDIPPLMSELEEKFRTMLSNVGPAA